MAKAHRKILEKLNARIEDFERLDPINQRGRKRPGSMNMHKQVSIAQTKRRIK